MTVGVVARSALAAALLCPIAVMSVAPAAAEPPNTPCVGGDEVVDPLSLILDLPLQEPDAGYSCEDKRDQCYSGQVVIGIYGERSVPVEAVRMCEEAYRACVAAHEGLGPSAENAPYPGGSSTGDADSGVPAPEVPVQGDAPPDSVTPPDTVTPPDSAGIPWPWPEQAPNCYTGKFQCHQNATTAYEHAQCDNALFIQCMQSKGPEAVG